MRSGETKSLDVDHGFAVSYVDLVEPDFPEGLDTETRRLYLDPQLEPEHRSPLGHAGDRELILALHRSSPPYMHRRIVTTFSLDASIKRGDAEALTHDYYANPLWVYVPVERSLGQAAVVSLIDRNPHSYRIGAANILDRDEEVITLHELRAGDGSDAAGVSVLLVPEGKSLKFQRDFINPNDRISSTKYRLKYDPDSHCGILLRPDMPNGHTRPKDEGKGDEGGSDREPRNPLVPRASGAAEVELPESQDDPPAYREVII